MEVNITKDDLCQGIQDCINKIIKEEGFISYTVHKNKISTKGQSYFGEIYKLDIKGETDNGIKEVNLFIKRDFPYTESWKLADFPLMFRNENLVHRTLFKALKELEEIHNVPPKERLRVVKSYEGINDNVIILENIAKKGYITTHRMDEVTLEYAEASIIALAKFHGLSFVLKKLKPNIYQSKIMTIKQGMLFDENFRKFAKQVYGAISSALSKEVKEKMDDFFPVMLEQYPKYMRGEMTDAICMCHGDYRSCNIMFKEQDDKIIDLIVIDFQLISHSSPAIDFIYFMISTHSRDFRRKYTEHLKKIYFKSLTKYLAFFNIEVDSVYSWDDFEEDYKKCLPYGLMYTIYLFPFFFDISETPIDLAKVNVFEVQVNLHKKWKECFEGIILDYIEIGYL